MKAKVKALLSMRRSILRRNTPRKTLLFMVLTSAIAVPATIYMVHFYSTLNYFNDGMGWIALEASETSSYGTELDIEVMAVSYEKPLKVLKDAITGKSSLWMIDVRMTNLDQYLKDQAETFMIDPDGGAPVMIGLEGVGNGISTSTKSLKIQSTEPIVKANDNDQVEYRLGSHPDEAEAEFTYWVWMTGESGGECQQIFTVNGYVSNEILRDWAFNLREYHKVILSLAVGQIALVWVVILWFYAMCLGVRILLLQRQYNRLNALKNSHV